MKTNNYFFALSAFVLLISCNNNNNNIETYNLNSFPKITSVNLNELKQIKGKSPANILFNDSLLILQDFSVNPRIHFLNRQTYKTIATYGIIGRGPHEYLNPKIIPSETDKDFLYINDFGKKNIYKIELDKILKNKISQNSISEFELPTKLHVSGSLYLKGEKIYGENFETSNDSTYFAYDLLTKKYDFKGKILENGYIDKMAIDDKKNANRNYIAYSKDNNKIIAGFLLFNIINIMDFDYNIEKQLVLGDNVLMPKDRDFFSEENIHYYKSPICLKKSFLILYNTGDNNNSEIHQFSYDGKPISRIILNKNYYNAYYDSKYKRLYTIDLENEYSISYLDINLGE